MYSASTVQSFTHTWKHSHCRDRVGRRTTVKLLCAVRWDYISHVQVNVRFISNILVY